MKRDAHTNFSRCEINSSVGRTPISTLTKVMAALTTSLLLALSNSVTLDNKLLTNSLPNRSVECTGKLQLYVSVYVHGCMCECVHGCMCECVHGCM